MGVCVIDPEERAERVAHMLEMNGVMRTLRDQIDTAAEMAKDCGETSLAFAAFHLAESIGVYMREVTGFMQRELEKEDD